MKEMCPPISEGLLTYLSSVFPDVAVDPRVTDPNRAFGRAEVIRHLRSVKEQQDQEGGFIVQD